jgi:DNA-binding response OmpR family regulator
MPPEREDPTQEQVYDLTSESVPPPATSILILEDDLDFSEMLEALLEDCGYQVTRVTSGVEGIREIMAADFDLILCDLVMPNLPGDMFYLAVQRTKPHLCKRFLFMTGHQADPKWDGFIRMVGGVVIWKPFALPDLLARMHEVLRAR